jgi:HSP20 family protein
MTQNIQDPFEEAGANLPALRGSNNIVSKGFVPATDVYEDEKNVFVETSLAGVRPEDVGVSVEKNVLTLQGSSKKEHEVEEKNYYRKEMRSGSFFRQIVLPAPVKEDEVKAEFEDGVLKVTCPKDAPDEAKKIEVEVVKKKK